MIKILMVEDDDGISFANQMMLERRGYEVQIAATLAEVREAVFSFSPGLILLDIMLPDGSGIDFLKEIRKSYNTPVLLLTSLGTSKDIVSGLAAGGNDYISKPFDNEVLLARIETQLRNFATVPDIITKGRLSLDITSQIARLDGADLILAKKEFALLLVFVQNEERHMSGEYLYNRIWGQPMSGDSQAVRKTVNNLSDKLADSGYHIAWSRGEGWCFEKA